MWTRRELMFFAVYAAILTVAFASGLTFCDCLGLQSVSSAQPSHSLSASKTTLHTGAFGRLGEYGAASSTRPGPWGQQVFDMVHTGGTIDDDQLRREHTALVHRHVAWMVALRHAMRAERPWEEFDKHGTNREWAREIHIPERIHDLEDELFDCLPDDEWDDVMARKNKAVAILNMQSRHLTRLKDKGLLWEFAYLELQGLLREMFTLQGKSERIKNFPYPRQYATLSYQFVRIVIVLLPFAAIAEFASLGEALQASWPTMAPHFIWAAIPFCALISWVFHTMDRIGRVGEPPFEGSANDVPISTIARGIEIDLRQMLGEPESHLPSPVPTSYGVQM